MEADGPGVQSHFQLYIEFEGSLGAYEPTTTTTTHTHTHTHTHIYTHGGGRDSLGEGFQGNIENNTDQYGDAQLYPTQHLEGKGR